MAILDEFFDTRQKQALWAGALQDIGNIWTRSAAAPQGLVQGGNMQRALTRNLERDRDEEKSQRNQLQMDLMRQRVDAAKVASEVAAEERARQEEARAAFMVPGMPEQMMGPPDSEGMQYQPEVPPTAPQTNQQMYEGFRRMAALDPAAAVQGMQGLANIDRTMTEKPSDFQRKMELVGGNLDEYRKQFGPQGSTTNVNLATEKAGLTELAKLGAKRIDSFQSAADTASEEIQLLDQMEKALDVFDTGIGGNARLFGAQMNELMGGDPRAAAAGELLRTNQTLLALERTAKMSGALSDTETKMIRDAGPSLTNTVAGNRLMISLQRAANQRMQARAEMATDWFIENDGRMAGFNKHFREWIDKQPSPVDFSKNTVTDWSDL